jgi:hypothetical protein
MTHQKNSSRQAPGRAPDQALQVVLGGHTVKAFVAAPRDMQIIGIVRMGMEFGLLAMSKAGHYLRINGSEVQRLDRVEVEAAILAAQKSGRGESFAASRRNARAPETPGGGPSHRPAPAVVQKKHRRVDPKLAANNSQLQPLAA